MGLVPVIAFDSNVFIYVLDEHPEFFASSRDALNKAATEPTVISALVYTETLSKLSGQTFKESLQWLNLICQRGQITVMPIDINLATLAAQLRSSHKQLKTPDAIHLATAIAKNAGTLFTNDRKLANIAKGYLKVKTL